MPVSCVYYYFLTLPVVQKKRLYLKKYNPVFLKLLNYEKNLLYSLQIKEKDRTADSRIQGFYLSLHWDLDPFTDRIQNTH